MHPSLTQLKHVTFTQAIWKVLIDHCPLGIYMARSVNEKRHKLEKKSKIGTILSERRGFHLTFYQVNFAIHHIRHRHVGFLSSQDSIGKYNKMSRYFL